MPEKISVQDFASKIREKYNAYQDVDDSTLTSKFIEKYPVYSDRVDFELQPDKMAVPNFVKRMDNPNAPFIQNEDGTVSSHRMAYGESDGKYVVYPTLFQEGDKLIEPEDPFGYAVANNNYLEFDTEKEASDYALGSWKKKQPNYSYHGDQTATPQPQEGQDFSMWEDFKSNISNIWERTKADPSRYNLFFENFTKHIYDVTGNDVGQANNMVSAMESIKKLEESKAKMKPTAQILKSIGEKDPAKIVSAAIGALLNMSDSMVKSIATGGTYMFLQPMTDSYFQSLEETATKEGTSAISIYMTEKDKELIPVVSGAIQGALEKTGMDRVTSHFLKKMPVGVWRKIFDIASTSGIEGVTEFLQSITEQVGQNIAAGRNIADIDWDEVWESAAQGVVGGGGMAAIGGAVTGTLPSKAPEAVTKEPVKPTEKDSVEEMILDATDLGVEETKQTEAVKENIDGFAKEVIKEVKKGKEYTKEDLTKELTDIEVLSAGQREVKKEIYKERKEEKVGEPISEQPTQETAIDETFADVKEVTPAVEEKMGLKLPEGRDLFTAVKSIESKEGLPFTSQNYERKVKRALSRTTISEYEKSVLDKWVEEYKVDVAKRQEARKPEIKKKIKERKEKAKKEKQYKPLEEYSMVSIKSFAKDSKHHYHKQATEIVAKDLEEKAKKATEKVTIKPVSEDLGPAKPQYPSKKKVAEKPVKEAKEEAPKTSDDFVASLISKKDKTSAENQTLKEAKQVQSIKEDLKAGKLRDAAKKIRETVISRMGLEEAQPRLMLELTKLKDELKKVSKEEKKEYQKAVRESEDKEKTRAEFRGTLAEQADFVQAKGRKIKSVQGVHTATKSIVGKKTTKATKKDLSDAIEDFNAFLVGRGRKPLSKDDRQNLLETGNLQGDIIRSEEEVKIANEKVLKRAVSESKVTEEDKAFKKAQEDKDGVVLDDYFPNEDFLDDGFALWGKKKKRRGEILVETRIKNGKTISVSQYLDKYVKPYIKNNFVFGKFLNLLSVSDKIYGKPITIVEADGIYNLDGTESSGLYSTSKKGNHYLVISKDAIQNTGLHEMIHYFTAPLLRLGTNKFAARMQSVGYSKEQINEMVVIRNKIHDLHEKTRVVQNNGGKIASAALSDKNRNELIQILRIETEKGELNKPELDSFIADLAAERAIENLTEKQKTFLNLYTTNTKEFLRSIYHLGLSSGEGHIDPEEGFYGLTSPGELIAEAISDPIFNLFLHTVQGEGKQKKSMLRSIVQYMVQLGSLITGVSTDVLDKMYPNSVLGQFEGLIGRYEELFIKPKYEPKGEFSIIAPNYRKLKSGYDMFFNKQKNTPESDKMADRVMSNASKLNQLNFGKEGKKLNLNLERIKRLVKFIMSNDPSKQELIDVVTKINESLPEGKKISLNEVNSSYSKASSRKMSKAKRKHQAIIDKAKMYSDMDLSTAKDMIAEYIGKKMPSYTGYKKKDIVRVLNQIRLVTDPKKFKEHVDEMNKIITDFKYDKALSNATSAKVKIKSFKRSKLPVNEKGLWRRFRAVDLKLLDQGRLELYTELVSILNFGKKKIKSADELIAWENIIEDIKTYMTDYEHIRQENLTNEKKESTEGETPEQKEAKKIKKENTVSAERHIAMNNIGRIYKKAAIKAKEVLSSKEMSERTRDRLEFFINIRNNAFDMRKLLTDDLVDYAEGLRYFAYSGELSNKAGSVMTKMEAIKRVREGLSTLKGSDLAKPRTWFSKMMSGANTSAQIVNFMAKMNKKYARSLNKLFFAKIRELDSKVHEKHRALMEELGGMVNSLKLKEKNLVRIQLFRSIFDSALTPNEQGYMEGINDNIEKLRKSLLNLIKATEYGKTEKSVSDAKKELVIFKELFASLKANGKNNVLTKEEKIFSGRITEILDEGLDDFRQSTQAYAGKEFKVRHEYTTARVIGTIDNETIGEKDGDIFKEAFDGKFDRLNELEAGFAKHKSANIGGVYYDNNIMNVMNKYLLQSNYDASALSEIITLNKILRDDDIRDKIGSENLEIVKKSLLSAVTRGRGNFEERAKWAHMLETGKNLFVVGRMGTVFQLSTQLLTTIPAIALNNPKGFMKASNVITKYFLGNKLLNIPGHPDVKTLKQWIRKFGHGLQNRDVMFERFETMSDYSGAKQRLKKITKRSEERTTWMLRRNDALAATWTFMSSYFESGGTLEHPNEDKIASAELDTDMLQNISNPRFTSELFKPSGTSRRVLLSLMYTFKSFALNQSLNTIYSLRHAKDPAARRLVAANLSNMLLYHTMSLLLTHWLGQAMGFFGDDEEKADKRSEMIMNNFWKKIMVRTLFDVGVTWIPEYGENIVQEQFDKYQIAIREAITGKDLNNRMEKMFFSHSGGPAKHMGGYSGMIEPIVKFTDDGLKIATGEEIDMYAFWLSTMAESVGFMKAMPFRGDIARLLRTQASIQKQGKPDKKSIDAYKGWQKNNGAWK